MGCPGVLGQVQGRGWNSMWEIISLNPEGLISKKMQPVGLIII